MNARLVIFLKARSEIVQAAKTIHDRDCVIVKPKRANLRSPLAFQEEVDRFFGDDCRIVVNRSHNGNLAVVI